mgnify:CR=1 FL=1
MKITRKQAERLGRKFKIDFSVVPQDEWEHALNVELEHGSMLSALTNVTGNSLSQTAKIAIAHLLEDPRYYYHLKKMEEKRDLYWKSRNKPKIFLK